MTHPTTGSDGRADHPQDAPSWGAPVAPPTPEGVGPDRGRPTGPNWGLTLLGLVLMGVATTVGVQQVTGIASVTALETHGPLLLVGVGVALALVGLVGMARRRS